MRKVMTTNAKIEKGGMRLLAAASLALTLAAFGCSTNRYPGNGQPEQMGPAYGPTPSSVTPGSSSGTQGVPPMASSYTGINHVNTDALAALAAEQGYRGRVLGTVNPQGVQGEIPVTGAEPANSAMYTNPQSTVNSSISSTPTPVITSGEGGGAVTIAASPAGTTAGVAAAPAVAATPTASLGTTGVTAATTAAATSATSAATRATTTSAIRTTGAPLTGSLASAPVVAGSGAFSPILMNSGAAPLPTGSTVATTGTTAAATPAATTSAAQTATTTRAVRSTTASSGLRINGLRSAGTTTTAAQTATTTGALKIITNSNGQVMVTNITNTAPTVKP